jgi:hypothetical protein
MSESKAHQSTTTINFDNTMNDRETGNARRSVTVRSEYSRPNTQLVTKANPIAPIPAMPSLSSPKYVGQSAFPNIDAFVLIIPNLLENSGFFTTNIKNPIINGMKTETRKDIKNIRDLRIFRISAQKVAGMLFISHLLLFR